MACSKVLLGNFPELTDDIIQYFQDDIPTLIKKGASYLVLVNPTQQDHAFAKDYKIVAETKEYLLYDLLQKP